MRLVGAVAVAVLVAVGLRRELWVSVGEPRDSLSGETPVGNGGDKEEASPAAKNATRWTSAADVGFIVFYWHTIKTGGTTMRYVFQHLAQLGSASFYYETHLRGPSWIGLMHTLTSRVQRRRLLVEMHNPFGMRTPAVKHIFGLRQLYQGVCPVFLITFVRKPVPLMMSLFSWRVFDTTPLCQWLPATNLQLRSLLGRSLVNVDDTERRSLAGVNASTPPSVLSIFDFVGVVERFDESLALLIKLIGLPASTAYVRVNSNRRPPEWRRTTQRFLAAHKQGSHGEAVDALKALMALSEEHLRTNSPRQVNCRWWGCKARLQQWGAWREGMCAETAPRDVLRLLVDGQALDDVLHALADAELSRLAQRCSDMELRRQALLVANKELTERREAALHETAWNGKHSTPSDQLNDCWPSWRVLAPEENCMRCTRTWRHAQPPNPVMRTLGQNVPCYEDCWSTPPPVSTWCGRALPPASLKVLGDGHRLCTPSCLPQPLPASEASALLSRLAAKGHGDERFPTLLSLTKGGTPARRGGPDER